MIRPRSIPLETLVSRSLLRFDRIHPSCWPTLAAALAEALQPAGLGALEMVSRPAPSLPMASNGVRRYSTLGRQIEALARSRRGDPRCRFIDGPMLAGGEVAR